MKLPSADDLHNASQTAQTEADQIYKRHRRSEEARSLEHYASRASNAASYLEKRSMRHYGSGHDMKEHGEGKPYGSRRFSHG